jgi:hypothetical protein
MPRRHDDLFGQIANFQALHAAARRARPSRGKTLDVRKGYDGTTAQHRDGARTKPRRASCGAVRLCSLDLIQSVTKAHQFGVEPGDARLPVVLVPLQRSTLNSLDQCCLLTTGRAGCRERVGGAAATMQRRPPSMASVRLPVT